MKSLSCLLFLLTALAAPAGAAETGVPGAPGLPDDARVEALMARVRVPGLAMARIHEGQVVALKTWGRRDIAQDLPLTPDTTLYAASMTKGAFAYAVMTLVQDGRLDLDRSIAEYLPRPLPEYPKYADLAGDERWRRLTPRLLLAHLSGFPNFRFFTPHGFDENAPLAFAFDPGARYGYSGEGINLLQFVIENGLGVDVGELMRSQVFDAFGMANTDMVWRERFAANLAQEYGPEEEPLGHRQRGSVRAAGSMDTTLRDFAGFLAALSQGGKLRPEFAEALLAPQADIRSIQQFPTLSTDTTEDNRGIALAAALGWVVYRTPEGRAFFKSGHEDGTNNLALCVRDGRDCLLIMSNSSNAESLFPYLIQASLGEVCFPWYWQSYLPFDRPELRAEAARGDSHPPCTAWPWPEVSTR